VPPKDAGGFSRQRFAYSAERAGRVSGRSRMRQIVQSGNPMTKQKIKLTGMVKAAG